MAEATSTPTAATARCSTEGAPADPAERAPGGILTAAGVAENTRTVVPHGGGTASGAVRTSSAVTGGRTPPGTTRTSVVALTISTPPGLRRCTGAGPKSSNRCSIERLCAVLPPGSDGIHDTPGANFERMFGGRPGLG
ncbi:hypothetical protein Ae168Ps1_5214c [Pseudonocardia sp. Ae168_Ps1]|nr:hypothetical protein Ae150APs1_5173c [Pseudonocardia sp. Ae150A_Ps1]OLL82808.1 hypothetical protein Ae168Ps1_5214c [Pseudonocardia sp. Ae168_Ps1]OLL83079.1 hypothetical protein Ae263Ps1_0134 [Pseudonocardia sp. Ae263_Ps1]OLL90882.1 hypothetical protein Ae356Ps1_0779c [Pseudonocardia sp. Ae356_Ps1]